MAMMEGVSVVCFAASYVVALLLELSRLFVRSGLRGALMIGFAAAGLFAQSLFLVYRALYEQLPLASAFDWYMVAAWVLAAMYLYLALYYRHNTIGVFVLPVVLGLIAAGALVADREPFPVSRAALLWGTVHGVLLLLGTVAVIVGFVAGMMYLAQAYRLKHKLPPRQGFQLPSLEWLERVNARAILTSVVLLGGGILSGAILNLVNHGESIDHVPWTDPIIWSSALTVVWLLAATVFNFTYQPARQGRKVAYLTVASFVFLALALAVSLFVDTEHSAAAGRAGQDAPLETTSTYDTPSLELAEPHPKSPASRDAQHSGIPIAESPAGGRG